MIDEIGIRFIDSCCGTSRYLGEMGFVEASMIGRSIAFMDCNHNVCGNGKPDRQRSREGRLV
ncbi:hypothetical protein BN1708_012255 [Verticillium longisporum]|uniref:Uncharacterized protein n=1 Tax=Verticillium longisporum TaxID=100787 RepID=A0A0G4L8T8_VERLO|nr:hypothetical protein BN1708_012255 [Verticillium longisporum]